MLGGSFNPAHEAHREISIEALRRLRLDAVWWLVSPQNPLKPSGQTALLAERLAAARAVSGHPRIVVSALEETLGTVYTRDTLAALAARFPRVRFVWLMGADNLIQLPAWKGWQDIVNTVPVAIFDRPSYSLRALAAQAARRFARHRLPGSSAGGLAGGRPPVWAFIRQRLNPQSSTRIRAAAQAWVRPSQERAPARRRATGKRS